MSDFEVRVRKTGELLLSRGYNFKGLRRQFGRVLCKYRGEFEKWYVPLDVHSWFGLIFHTVGLRSQVRGANLGDTVGRTLAFSQRVNQGNNVQHIGFISQT